MLGQHALTAEHLPGLTVAAQIEGLPMPQQLDTRSLQQPAAQRGWMGPAIGIEQATFGQATPASASAASRSSG